MMRSVVSHQTEFLDASSPGHSEYGPTGTDVPVDDLITYLVAAKRALSSIHLVHRATTILSDARSVIEATAARLARTKYLRSSLAVELKELRGFQFEIESSARAVKSDIQTVLHELDETDKRLFYNIELLRTTRIEDGFKNSVQQEFPTNEQPSRDYLHDFVDDKPVDELKANIQTAIDSARTASSGMDQTIQSLETDLQAINAALQTDLTSGLNSSTDSTKQHNIAQLMQSLERHAHEMAVSLESLVKHYDLCVTAIKHTEGAGAAVARNIDVQDIPEGVDVTVTDVLTSPTQTLTEDERTEMLQVLSTDAGEVVEVVSELQDRALEMETHLDQLLKWNQANEQHHQETAHAFRLMEQVSTKLSTQHLAEVSKFAIRWAEEKVRIQDGTIAMGELCDVYTQFLTAYDGMIVETARRRTVQKRMQRIVEEAHKSLEQLYADDLSERETFRDEQGDFLPSDIWTGLGSLPPRFVFQRIDVGADSVPELPRKTVEDALRRLKSGDRTA